jgi:hypothetical protein
MVLVVEEPVSVVVLVVEEPASPVVVVVVGGRSWPTWMV